MKNKKRLLVIALLILSVVSAYAGGNKEIPQIPPVTSGQQYLSPNGDGVQDEAELEFTATVRVKSKEGYIPEYSLSISDENGKIVKQVTRTEKSDMGWFTRLFAKYTEHQLTKSIAWDGKDEEGNTVPDGTYKVQLRVVAASKKEAVIDIDNFVVDTVAPQAEIRPAASFTSIRAFSPNGDGQKDYFVIDQDGTTEAAWKGEFLDEAGISVFSYELSDSEPQTYAWDGLASDGSEVPDGKYSYKFSCTDLAGNASEVYELDDIILDRTITVIEFVEDVNDPRNRSFSPNGDGVKDILTLTPVVPSSEKVISWIATLMNSTITTEPEVYMHLTGTGTDLPGSFVFDGTDTNGGQIPETDLDFEFTLYYSNNNIAQASFTQVGFNNLKLDNTPPEITLLRGRENMEKPFTEEEVEVFSPNGDGRKDEARIFVDANEGVDWTVDLFDTDGTLLGTVDSKMMGSTIVWDGTDMYGKMLPDGQYFAEGSFVDYAGNVSGVSRYVMIDTRDVYIVLVYPDGFSPNGDGSGDTFVVTVAEAELAEGITAWEADFYNDASMTEPVYSTGGTSLPDFFEWDGKIESTGEIAPEGIYGFAFSAYYEKGDVVDKYDSLVIEYINPNISVDNIYAYSSDFAVTGTVDDPTAKVTIELDGKTFKGAVDGNKWSADVSGIGDGTWDVAAVALDPAGNRGVDYSTDEVYVDSAGPLVQFNPMATNDTTPVLTGTTRDDRATITLEVGGQTQVAQVDGENWSVTLTEALAPGVYPVKISALTPGGSEFTIVYDEGLIVDITPPVVDITVTSNPFAQTEEGVEGEMYVSIKVTDDTGVDSWTMDIKEKARKGDGETLRSYSGDGDPSDQIAWSGEAKNDAQGHIVDEFTLVINVTDKGGNTTEYRKDVPLDIIIIKKDGKLYLMVPNIIFGAYKYTLDSRGEVMKKRNWDSIAKVVEIYRKYPQFGLGLEAHALNIYEKGTEKWKSEEEILLPLTEKRAATVKKALEQLGISADRIISNSYGGVYPIASTTDPKVWWKNRRVEFIMLPPSGGGTE
ncbi:MAG: gliding motility-associated C-terminal domain-containing protein [Spirochaetales bacterium]|nr:gliding motility-associated C-terminal domain-containing protein [Spirochaetales bacterium]